MDPTPFELRCRSAMRHALWFSALFTIACVLFAFVGPEEDAAITSQLAVVGAVLFAANLAAQRVFLPRG